MSGESAFRRSIALRLSLVSIASFLALPDALLAADSVYTGTMRNVVKTGQSPSVNIVTYGGTLDVSSGGGITIQAGDVTFSASSMVSNPPTFAGVLQSTTFITVMNPQTGMAGPGGGPGPFSFVFPTPAGSPGVNSLGAPARFGAVSAAGGGANYGGLFPFLFNFVAHDVFFGGGGGAPNLACPAGNFGNFGSTFVSTAQVSCIGLTTGPLPAATLPSVVLPFVVTLSGWRVATQTVFAGAPAPLTTTTLTDMGSVSLNSGVAVPGGTGTTGMIQLVAPFLFHIQLGGPLNIAGQSQNAGITEWNLTLLPEPGPSAMLLAGIAGLIGVRRAERRRRGSQEPGRLQATPLGIDQPGEAGEEFDL